jgi:hypothetical protein
LGTRFFFGFDWVRFALVWSMAHRGARRHAPLGSFRTFDASRQIRHFRTFPDIAVHPLGLIHLSKNASH